MNFDVTLMFIAANLILLGRFIIAVTRRRGANGGAPARGGGSPGLTGSGEGMGLAEVYIFSILAIWMTGLVGQIPFVSEMAQIYGTFTVTMLITLALSVFFKQFLSWIFISLDEAIFSMLSIVFLLWAAGRFELISQAFVWFAQIVGLSQ